MAPSVVTPNHSTLPLSALARTPWGARTQSLGVPPLPPKRASTLVGAPAHAAGLTPPVGQKSEVPRDWRLGFVTQEEEITQPTPLKLLSGQIPDDLRGTLFRNGPGRLDVYGERLTHWFDGDGKPFKIAITASGATYQSRFVATARKLQEDAAQKRLFSGFSVPPLGGFWGVLKGYNDKCVANTNIVVHAGKLLALQETGLPYRLDPVTMGTLGTDNFGGIFSAGTKYTAHPKPHGDDMWGFAVDYGYKNTVQTYCTHADGSTVTGGKFDMPFAGLIHDFCLTKTKAIFIVPPWTMGIPIRFLLGLGAMDKLLKWKPELGTHIIVMDLATGAVSKPIVAKPTLLFHTVNAYEDADGKVTLDVCGLPDTAGLQVAVDVMFGRRPERHMPTVQRLEIADDKLLTMRELSATTLDFPRVAPQTLRKPHTTIYGVSWDEDAAFMNRPTCLDVATGKTVQAPMGAEEYAGEGVLVPKRGAVSEQDAYLLSVVLNAPQQRSELRIYDAADLAADAVCRLQLPQVVPLGFHGNWLDANASTALA